MADSDSGGLAGLLGWFGRPYDPQAAYEGLLSSQGTKDALQARSLASVAQAFGAGAGSDARGSAIPFGTTMGNAAAAAYGGQDTLIKARLEDAQQQQAVATAQLASIRAGGIKDLLPIMKLAMGVDPSEVEKGETKPPLTGPAKIIAQSQGTIFDTGDPFLNLVAHHESKYRPNVGWGETDLSPYKLDATGFPDWPGNPGPAGNSTAAGLFQITGTNWHTFAPPLIASGAMKPDFSPESQIAVAKAMRAANGTSDWLPYNKKLAAAHARGDVVKVPGSEASTQTAGAPGNAGPPLALPEVGPSRVRLLGVTPEAPAAPAEPTPGPGAAAEPPIPAIPARSAPPPGQKYNSRGEPYNVAMSPEERAKDAITSGLLKTNPAAVWGSDPAARAAQAAADVGLTAAPAAPSQAAAGPPRPLLGEQAGAPAFKPGAGGVPGVDATTDATLGAIRGLFSPPPTQMAGGPRPTQVAGPPMAPPEATAPPAAGGLVPGGAARPPIQSVVPPMPAPSAMPGQRLALPPNLLEQPPPPAAAPGPPGAPAPVAPPVPAPPAAGPTATPGLPGNVPLPPLPQFTLPTPPQMQNIPIPSPGAGTQKEQIAQKIAGISALVGMPAPAWIQDLAKMPVERATELYKAQLLQETNRINELYKTQLQTSTAEYTAAATARGQTRYQIQQELAKQGIYIDQNGTAQWTPNWIELQGQKAATEQQAIAARQKEVATTEQQLIGARERETKQAELDAQLKQLPLQKRAEFLATDYADNVNKPARAAEPALRSLTALGNSLANFRSGPSADNRLLAAKWLQDIGGFFGVSQNSETARMIAAGETINKQGTSLGYQMARELGSREAQMIVQQAILANPGLAVSPQGNKQLIALIGEGLQREMGKRDFYDQYFLDNKGSYEGAEKAFQKANPWQVSVSNVVPYQVKDEADLRRQNLPVNTQFIGPDGLRHRVGE